MRHATAGSAGAGSDHERPLTTEGRREAARVGVRLDALGLAPSHVVSSTALRCKETWGAVAGELGSPLAPTFDDALYNADPRQIIRVLAAHHTLLVAETESVSQPASPETILILAHNPGISVLAFELGSGDDRSEAILRSGFAPASFAAFEIANDADPPTHRNTKLSHFEHAS